MTKSVIQVLQPVVGQDELFRISNVLESKWLGKGQVVTDFEAQFAKHVGADPQQLISTTCGTVPQMLGTPSDAHWSHHSPIGEEGVIG